MPKDYSKKTGPKEKVVDLGKRRKQREHRTAVKGELDKLGKERAKRQQTGKPKGDGENEEV